MLNVQQNINFWICEIFVFLSMFSIRPQFWIKLHKTAYLRLIKLMTMVLHILKNYTYKLLIIECLLLENNNQNNNRYLIRNRCAMEWKLIHRKLPEKWFIRYNPKSIKKKKKKSEITRHISYIKNRAYVWIGCRANDKDEYSHLGAGYS